MPKQFENNIDLIPNELVAAGLTSKKREEIAKIEFVGATLSADSFGVVFYSGEDGFDAEAMRWGFPAGQRTVGYYITSTGNLWDQERDRWNPRWRQTFEKSARRCIVPFTRVAGQTTGNEPGREAQWYVPTANAPFAMLAGVWISWAGLRGQKHDTVMGYHKLFAIIESASAVSSERLPLVLSSRDEWDAWFRASPDEILAMHRSPANLEKLNPV